MKKTTHSILPLAAIAAIALAVAPAQAQTNIAPLGTADNAGFDAVWGDPTGRVNNGGFGWTTNEGIHGPAGSDAKFWVTWVDDYTIDRVTVYHCSFSPSDYVARDYLIQSLNPGGDPNVDGSWTAQLTVTGNTTVAADHPLPSSVATKGIRVFFNGDKGPSSGGQVRWEELEVFGVLADDENPPVITAVDPDGVTGVYPGVTLVATFDESIALTGGGSISITDTFDGSDTVAINVTSSDQVTVSGMVSGNTFTHPHGTLADDLTAAYRWSKDLQAFNAGGGTKVDFTTGLNTPVAGTTTVTAAVDPAGTATGKLFVDMQVTQP